MKIIRLKRGYRIRLSDSEFEGLMAMVNLGEADIQAMEEFDFETTFSAVERRGYRALCREGAFDVEDRR